MLILPNIDLQLNRMRVVAESDVARGPRRPHRKVKTGCKTCRIRRVKCDEKKPCCFKCTSTGRTCDGYSQPGIASTVQTFSCVEIKSVWPSKALATLPEFGDDMQHLEFYYHCVGPKLSGRFDTDFWLRTILQMAHTEPGVRNALIALGHLSQRQSGSLQHARRYAMTTAAFERRVFWINYNKAIRYLIDQMTRRSFSAEVGLVICLLFACIEFLQADAIVAFTHIRSGLNIVHEMRQRNKGGSKLWRAEIDSGPPMTQADMIEQTIVPILTQALASALPYGSSIEKDFDFLESCPKYFIGTAFAGLNDARSSFFDLRNAALLLARDMAMKLYQSTPFGSSDHRRQNDILEYHSIWLQAFTSLESSRTWSQSENHAFGALRVGFYASYTACSCIMDKTQMTFDAHLASFQILVEQATLLAHSLEATNSMKAAANFTFDTSLVPALFYTAIRCRCPSLRRKAVDLLAFKLPREGLWDPEQHRKVAERVIEIEELEVDSKGWPKESSRLCRSSVGTDVDENNRFEASFLYTKHIAVATRKCWSEQLTLGECRAAPLSLRLC